jgi:hypothetical protein
MEVFSMSAVFLPEFQVFQNILFSSLSGQESGAFSENLPEGGLHQR